MFDKAQGLYSYDISYLTIIKCIKNCNTDLYKNTGYHKKLAPDAPPPKIRCHALSKIPPPK